MKRWRAGAWLAGMILAALSSQNARAAPDYSVEVADRIELLRQVWPGIPDAELTDADSIAVHNGRIQVGRPALARLLDPVLGEAGGHLVTFVLAHEAWHTVQLARLSREEVRTLRKYRLLECEADFMAATVAAGEARRAAVGPVKEYGLRKAIADHVVATTVPASDAAYYPAPALRAQTIALAWTIALNPGAMRSSAGISTTQPPGLTGGTLAMETCRKITNASDGSIGQILITSEQEEAANSFSVDPAPYKVRIMNIGTRPVEVSYLLFATGKKQTAVGGPWMEEIYDVIEHSAVAPSQGATEHVHALRGYEPANPLRKFSHVIVTTPIYVPGASNALAASRYVGGEPRPTGAYCREAVDKPPRAQDRKLLARLATIALSAEEGFRTIAGDRMPDLVDMRQYRLTGGLGEHSRDAVTVSQYGKSVLLTLFESEDEAAIRAEFDRLLKMFKATCGTTSVDTGSAVPQEGEKGALGLSLKRFAPGVLISIHTQLWRNIDLSPSSAEAPLPGGFIFVRIMRDESWDPSD